MCFFQGETTLSKLLSALLKKESTLKGKNLLPEGANSSLLEWIPLRNGLVCIIAKLEVTQHHEKIPI